MDENKKRRIMLSHMAGLASDPRWKFFQDYLAGEVEELLTALESVAQDKNAYIILGKIKAYRNILHLDNNAINILLNSTPDGPVGE